MRYRVKKFSCFHAGKEYAPGEFLPETLSPEELNVHLPNIEIVEIRQSLPNLFEQWKTNS